MVIAISKADDFDRVSSIAGQEMDTRVGTAVDMENGFAVRTAEANGRGGTIRQGIKINGQTGRAAEGEGVGLIQGGGPAFLAAQSARGTGRAGDEHNAELEIERADAVRRADHQKRVGARRR